VPRHGFQERVVAGSFVAAFGAGDAFVGEGVDDGPARPLSDLVEDEKLVLDRLGVCADPHIKCRALHLRDDLTEVRFVKMRLWCRDGH
jgi:hypothetical protein